MLLLILDSLGSIELLFIAIMALVFFGPRKLPQISRTIGKNLAEFRRASEDFKRTWDREVSLEEFKRDPYIEPTDDDYPANQTAEAEGFSEPQPEAILSVEEVPESSEPRIETDAPSAETKQSSDNTIQPELMSKQNWL